MKFNYGNNIKLVVRVYNNNNEILDRGFRSEEESWSYTELLGFLGTKCEEWIRDTDGGWVKMWEA